MINRRFLLAILLTIILYPVYLIIQTVRDIDHRLKTNYYREQLSKAEETFFNGIASMCFRPVNGPLPSPTGGTPGRFWAKSLLESTKTSPFWSLEGTAQITSIYHTLTQTATEILIDLILLIVGPHLKIQAC